LKQQAQNEEEMERMRDEYQHEIRELSKTHVAVLNEDDSNTKVLFAEYAKEIAARNEEIDMLRLVGATYRSCSCSCP
jgi:phenylpyruvate tautomerase PptA (4-oxalocrotonate tautomerase family)